MKPLFLRLVPAVIFAAIIAVFALTLKRDTGPQASRYIDRKMPDFDLAALDDNEARVSRIRLEGKIALINIFGSWCIACQIEHPLLMQISKSGTIPIIGINWRDDREDAKGWLARHGNPYMMIGYDPDSTLIIDLGVTGAPETFILDHRGWLRYRYQGPLTPVIWTEEISPLIAELQIQASKARGRSD